MKREFVQNDPSKNNDEPKGIHNIEGITKECHTNSNIQQLLDNTSNHENNSGCLHNEHEFTQGHGNGKGCTNRPQSQHKPRLIPFQMFPWLFQGQSDDKEASKHGGRQDTHGGQGRLQGWFQCLQFELHQGPASSTQDTGHEALDKAC